MIVFRDQFYIKPSKLLERTPQDRQILGALFYWGCLGKLALTKCPVSAHS